MSEWNSLSLGEEARLRLEINQLRAERDELKAKLDHEKKMSIDVEIKQAGESDDYGTSDA